jgi:hypothetical protein
MFDETKIIIIQKWFRKCISSLHLIRHKIKQYLNHRNLNQNKDDVIELLIKKFGYKIKNSQIRMWYDIFAFDNMYICL